MKDYEEINIEIIKLSLEDIITASGDKPFDGEDDTIGDDWN